MLASVEQTIEGAVEEAVQDPASVRQVIKDGFPIGWFDHLSGLFGTSALTFAGIVGIDSRTLSRRRHEGRLSSRESNALYHLAVLYAHARDVLGSAETVKEWLHSPEPDFAGVPPIELIDTAPGIKEVDQLLGRIEHGVF